MLCVDFDVPQMPSSDSPQQPEDRSGSQHKELSKGTGSSQTGECRICLVLVLEELGEPCSTRRVLLGWARWDGLGHSPWPGRSEEVRKDRV